MKASPSETGLMDRFDRRSVLCSVGHCAVLGCAACISVILHLHLPRCACRRGVHFRLSTAYDGHERTVAGGVGVGIKNVRAIGIVSDHFTLVDIVYRAF